MARQDLEPRKIDLDEPEDVRFWTQQYGCTENQLRLAMEAVGPVAQDVREQLAKQAKENLRKA